SANGMEEQSLESKRDRSDEIIFRAVHGCGRLSKLPGALSPVPCALSTVHCEFVCSIHRISWGQCSRRRCSLDSSERCSASAAGSSLSRRWYCCSNCR